MITRCGHLPLAIRLAGARLAHRPRWRVRDLAVRLATGRDTLTELSAGERSVGQAFALSFAQLDLDQQRMFRLLALHPGGFFDDRAAAAIADLLLPDAQDLLDSLVDAHLVDEPEAGPARQAPEDLYARPVHRLVIGLAAVIRQRQGDRRGGLDVL